MKSAVLAATLFCAAAVASAQTATTGGPSGAQSLQSFSARAPARNVDDLAKLLGLDEGQKALVKAILDEQQARLEEFAQEAKASGQTPTFEQAQATMAQLQKATRQSLSAILNDAQLKKFDALEQTYSLSASPSSTAGLMLQAASAGCERSGGCQSR
jgi:Tfp pilus assembly protein PilE